MDKAFIEIKLDAKIEVHHHDAKAHDEIIKKMTDLDEHVKQLVGNPLNEKEKKALQGLVDHLAKLGKPD